MKKIIFILIACLLLGGCSNGVEIDLKELENTIPNITINNENVFSDCVPFDIETLESKYDIDSTYIEEITAMMPMLVNNANMVVVAKAKSNRIDDVQIELNKIIDSYDSAWGMGYAPDEYLKVKDRLVTVRENYIIIIISPNNNLVLDTILSR